MLSPQLITFSPAVFKHLLAFCLVFLGGIAHGQFLNADNAPASDLFTPQVPNLNVGAYILVDADTGTILAAQNADSKVPVASITKVMTGFVVMDQAKRGQLDLEADVPVSRKAWSTGGSKMFIRHGSRVPLMDLMRGMVIQSGNDAAVALAEFVGGDEEGFVQLMNRDSAAMHMKQTTWANASGLPSDKEGYSTARDLTILARRLINDFPEHYALYNERNFTYSGITQRNRNQLLWLDPSVDGIKTGHTEEAGYCLISSAVRNGMRLIAVVIGAESEAERNLYSRRLLEFGFRNYSTELLVELGQVLKEEQVWGGLSEKIPLGSADDLKVTLPQSWFGGLDFVVEIDGDLIAPVKRNQEVGKIRIVHKQQEEPIAEVPLVALRSAKPMGFFGLTWARIQLFFHRLTSLE